MRHLSEPNGKSIGLHAKVPISFACKELRFFTTVRHLCHVCLMLCGIILVLGLFNATTAEPLISANTAVKLLALPLFPVPSSCLSAVTVAQADQGGDLGITVTILLQCLFATVSMPYNLPLLAAFAPSLIIDVDASILGSNEQTIVIGKDYGRVKIIEASDPSYASAISDGIAVVLKHGTVVILPRSSSPSGDKPEVLLRKWSVGISYVAAVAALQADPTDPILWCKLSVAAIAKGEPSDSIQSYMNKALFFSSKSDENEFNYMMALSFAIVRRCDSALTYCDKIPQAAPVFKEVALLRTAISDEKTSGSDFCKLD